jgi:hypothetical protein
MSNENRPIHPNSLTIKKYFTYLSMLESVMLEEHYEDEDEDEEAEFDAECKATEQEPELEPIELYGELYDSDDDDDDDYCNAVTILQSTKLFKSKCIVDCPICYEKEKCYAFFYGCGHVCCFDCMLQMDNKKCYYNCNTC